MGLFFPWVLVGVRLGEGISFDHDAAQHGPSYHADGEGIEEGEGGQPETDKSPNALHGESSSQTHRSIASRPKPGCTYTIGEQPYRNPITISIDSCLD